MGEQGAMPGERSDHQQPSPLWEWFENGLILVALIAGIWIAHDAVRRVDDRHLADAFRHRGQILQSELQTRLREHETIVRGGLALHASSDDVRPDEWRQFVLSYDLPRLYPDLRVLGYVDRRPSAATGGAPRFIVTMATFADGTAADQYRSLFEDNAIAREGLIDAGKQRQPIFSRPIKLAPEATDGRGGSDAPFVVLAAPLFDAERTADEPTGYVFSLIEPDHTARTSIGVRATGMAVRIRLKT